MFDLAYLVGHAIVAYGWMFWQKEVKRGDRAKHLLLAQGVLFKLVFYVQRASDAFFKCETLFLRPFLRTSSVFQSLRTICGLSFRRFCISLVDRLRSMSKPWVSLRDIEKPFPIFIYRGPFQKPNIFLVIWFYCYT